MLVLALDLRLQVFDDTVDVSDGPLRLGTLLLLGLQLGFELDRVLAAFVIDVERVQDPELYLMDPFV